MHTVPWLNKISITYPHNARIFQVSGFFFQMHPPFYDVTSRRQWLKLEVNSVPEYLICKYPKKGNSWIKTVWLWKKFKKSAKLKKILYTLNEILKQRDWILIRFTFYDHILTGFWKYSMPIAIRTMENNSPPPSINIKDIFFSNNMRRLHGHRTFTGLHDTFHQTVI